MTLIIIFFVVLIIGYIVLGVLPALSVYGWFLSDKKIEETLIRIKPTHTHGKYFGGKIISCRQSFIAESPTNWFLWKWYINDVGVIPRWSVWHGIIQEMSETLPDTEQYLAEMRAAVEKDPYQAYKEYIL